jgi:HSP20 family molecular chaperone IbpA
MSSYFDFDDIDEIFGDFDRIMRKLRDLNGAKRAIRGVKLKDNGEVEQIDEPEVKGYVIRWRLESDQPMEPLNPLEPIIRRSRWRRPLTPNRLNEAQEDAFGETLEPLIDVFDGENEVKVYIELPHGKRDDVQLNVTKGNVEVKTKEFYKLIKIPADADIEKASSRHKNRVLEVTIPKRKKPPESETHRITIE